MSSGAENWRNASGNLRRAAINDQAKAAIDELDNHLSGMNTAMQRLKAGLAGDEPLPTRTIRVPSGSNLQAAIEQADHDAADGMVTVLVEPLSTYTGNFKLPNRTTPAKNLILIRPDFADNNLPARDTYITAEHTDLPKLKSADNLTSIVRTGGQTADGYAFLGMQFEPLNVDRDMVQLGSDAFGYAHQPRSHIFDRCHFRADPVKGQHRGIAANSGDLLVIGCYMPGFKQVGRDAQCISCWTGPGRHEFAFNYLEASGENVMYGGSWSAEVDTVPTGIDIHDNIITKDFSWQTDVTEPLVKNLFELKNARDVTFRRNVCDGSWLKGQGGYALVFTPKVHRLDDGEVWVTVSNVLIESNVFRHIGAWINIDNGQGGGKFGENLGARTSGTHGIVVRNNLVYNVNDDPRWIGDARLCQIGNQGANPDGPTGIVIDHNTIYKYASLNTLMNFYGDAGTLNGKMGPIQYTNNIAPEGSYGIHGGVTLGSPTLLQAAPGSTLTGNTIERGSRTVKYPTGNNIVPKGTLAVELDATAEPRPGGLVAAAITTDGKPVGADLSTLPKF